MRLDRLTVKAQEALAAAQARAGQSGHSHVTPLHVLEALLTQEGGLVGPLLEKVGIPAERIRDVTAAELSRLPTQSQQAGLALDATLGAVLIRAETEAAQLTDEYTSVEHFLLALIHEPSEAREVLTTLGADRDAVIEAI